MIPIVPVYEDSPDPAQAVQCVEKGKGRVKEHGSK